MDIAISKEGDSARARLSGRFDVGTISTFRNTVRPLIADDDVATVTIDFEQVMFLDSSALGMLLLMREEAQRANKTIVLARCGPSVLRILGVAQFPKLFRIE